MTREFFYRSLSPMNPLATEMYVLIVGICWIHAAHKISVYMNANFDDYFQEIFILF